MLESGSSRFCQAGQWYLAFHFDIFNSCVNAIFDVLRVSFAPFHHRTVQDSKSAAKKWKNVRPGCPGRFTPRRSTEIQEVPESQLFVGFNSPEVEVDA